MFLLPLSYFVSCFMKVFLVCLKTKFTKLCLEENYITSFTNLEVGGLKEANATLQILANICIFITLKSKLNFETNSRLRILSVRKP